MGKANYPVRHTRDTQKALICELKLTELAFYDNFDTKDVNINKQALMAKNCKRLFAP